MIAPSTETPPIETALRQLAEGVDHYYLKSASIVETIQHDGRTFYSKFRRIDEAPNAIVLTQHLRREITLALPLLQEGQGDKIVIEYLGQEPELFLQTLIRLLDHLKISDYQSYRGKRSSKRQVILPLQMQPLESLHAFGGELSDLLQTRLSKEWRILPDRRLPEDYNLYTLPYGYIN